MDAIKVTLEIGKEELDSIIATGLYDGIDDWCMIVEPVGVCLGETWSEQLSLGGKLRFTLTEPFDDEDTEVYEMDRDKFMKGLQKYMDGLEDQFEVVEEIPGHGFRFDASKIDSAAADMIFQYALFGEIVFG